LLREKATKCIFGDQNIRPVQDGKWEFVFQFKGNYDTLLGVMISEHMRHHFYKFTKVKFYDTNM